MHMFYVSINVCAINDSNVNPETHEMYEQAVLLEGSTSFKFAPGDEIVWTTDNLKALGYKDFKAGIYDTYILCTDKDNTPCMCEIIICKVVKQDLLLTGKPTESAFPEIVCERINIREFIK